MSAVARIMVARGLPVSGTDAKDLPVMPDLAAAGARIHVGYAAANLGDAQTVVAGSAIRPDNPEHAAARAAGLPVLHRSEALAATMAGHPSSPWRAPTANHHHLDDRGAARGRRARPVLRHRRQRPGAGRQRRHGSSRHLCRRGRRVRRLLPELPPARSRWSPTSRPTTWTTTAPPRPSTPPSTASRRCSPPTAS